MLLNFIAATKFYSVYMIEISTLAKTKYIQIGYTSENVSGTTVGT